MAYASAALASARSNVSDKSNLDGGFLRACHPVAERSHSQESRQNGLRPDRSRSRDPAALPGQDEIMGELRQVTHVSCETARAVEQVMQKIGFLCNLLQQTLEKNAGSDNRGMDIDLAGLNARINVENNAQMQQTLAGHHDDIGQLIDNSVSRHMQQLTQQLQPQRELERQPQREREQQAQSLPQSMPQDLSQSLPLSQDCKLISTPSDHRVQTPAATKLSVVIGKTGSSELIGLFSKGTMDIDTHQSWGEGEAHAQRKRLYNRVIGPASLLLVVLDFLILMAGIDVKHRHLVRQPAEQPPPWILQIDAVFSAAFVLDVLLRTYVTRRWRSPCGRGAGRLYFDAIVTAMSLMDVILRVTDSSVHIAGLRFLRFVRLFRLVRMTRAVQAFGQRSRWLFEVLLLLECMGNFLLPLITILFVLFMMGLLVAMLFSEMITASLAGRTDPVSDMDLVRLYGSLWGTYFTLFTAITGGAEWGQLFVPLHALSSAYTSVFTFLIALMNFGVLNVVAAVLFAYVLRHRDSLLQRETFMNQERDQNSLQVLRDLFRASKKERNGRITEKTCCRVLEGNEGIKQLKTLDLTVPKVMSLFRMLERDSSNRTDIEEFLFLVANSKGDPALLLAAMMRCESTRIVKRVDKVHELAETRFAQVLQEDPDVLSGVVQPHQMECF